MISTVTIDSMIKNRQFNIIKYILYTPSTSTVIQNYIREHVDDNLHIFLNINNNKYIENKENREIRNEKIKAENIKRAISIRNERMSMLHRKRKANVLNIVQDYYSKDIKNSR